MQYHVSEGIARLTFDHPEKANALDLEGWGSMRDMLQRADADEEVKVAILEGAGKHFCAGIDLSLLTGLTDTLKGSKEEVEAGLLAFIHKLQDCITAIERCRKPVIASVHGACIGGGVDIITACDLRFCTKDATFSVKEIDLGIVADLGTLQRLPPIVGPGIAAELAFTARPFDGKEALRIGLVNDCLSNQKQLAYRVDRVAESIAAKPARLLAGIKKTLLYNRGRTVEEGLKFVAGVSAGVIAGK